MFAAIVTTFYVGTSNDRSPSSGPKPKNFKSPSLDRSFRLDEKMQYKKLLDLTLDSNSSSLYQTASNSFRLNHSKLSNASSSASKSKETTKERIIRVLDDIDNEAVVIKDSDSEDSVIMVNPPSPKPDIKVDPVNSFKKIVDTSKMSKKDWLDDL